MAWILEGEGRRFVMDSNRFIEIAPRPVCEVCSDEPASMRCDCCGTRYGKRCASRPDPGGFNCPDPGCNLYGEGAKG